MCSRGDARPSAGQDVRKQDSRDGESHQAHAMSVVPGSMQLRPFRGTLRYPRVEWDQEEDDHYNEENGVHSTVRSDVEDDRLYVEMPGYDASLNFAESQIGVDEDEEAPDPFQHWDQGMA